LRKTLDSASASKQETRELALSRRDSIPPEKRKELNMRVLENLASLDAYKKAGRILLYASYRSEVDTGPIIEHAFKDGKEVVLPKVDESNGCLTKHIINGMHDVSKGFRGIPEPTTKACIKVEEVDLLIVPGVAFNPSGARIGYGGGYYDRLLPRVKGLRPIIALAYEEQIFEILATEGHDIGMDSIITPERIISCHG